MQEKEIHGRKRSAVGGCFAKVRNCIPVYESRAVLNQVLAAAAIISTWTNGNNLCQEMEKVKDEGNKTEIGCPLAFGRQYGWTPRNTQNR